MKYRSPFLTAVVWMARASLPAPGSVRAYPAILLPLRLRHQVSLFLGLGAPGEEREAVEPGVHRQDDAERRIHVLELFAREAQADVVEAGAAVLLRHAHAQEPQLRHAAEDAVAVEAVIAIELADARRHFPGRPLANRLLDQPLFVREVEADHAGLRKRISRRLFWSRNESDTRSVGNSRMMSRLSRMVCRERAAG